MLFETLKLMHQEFEKTKIKRIIRSGKSFDDMVAEVEDEISTKHMTAGEETFANEGSAIEGEALKG